MKFKSEHGKLYGKVNYEGVTETGKKICINNIFNISETGAYFDWGLESCGFGQFSFSYSDGKWTIMNECMEPESSSMILKAFEDAIRASGDVKAIYCLNKIISQISHFSNSLSKSILLIWNKATNEGGEVKNFESVKKELKKTNGKNREKSFVFHKQEEEFNDVKINYMETEHYSYTNKQGTFYRSELMVFFDVKGLQYGELNISKTIDLNTSEEKISLTSGIKLLTLEKLIKTLEQNDGQYNHIWNIWKNDVNMKGNSKKLAKDLIDISVPFESHRISIK